MYRIGVLLLALVCLPGPQAVEPVKPGLPSPLSPQEALKHFHLDAGLRLELVASEPQIESPVALAFDEDGKLWVVEMRDYPNGPKPGQPPQGRIKVLEDWDGDGLYETSRIFADGLLFANGLLPWKGGVVVTAAPHIVFLRDTDGDGKADQREVLYEGFAAENPQLRVSHPVLGIDNWIYVANGLRGGKVKRHGRADKPVSISGMDFRFDLIHDRHEAISGQGQYGNTFDDWGQRFVCDNRHHLRHVVLPSEAIKRNPFLAVPDVVEDISELDLEPGPLSSGGKIYPLSKNWTTSSLHVGRFTAACGVHIYRGDLLPAPYRGAAFTCDPTGNLVHMEVLTPHGATFRARPAKAGVEFLATTDEWFRPVSMALGPDGALYIVDMYRAVIEHPEFMPDELKKRPDLTRGQERGRIWRVVPAKHAERPNRPQLSSARSEELVKLLAHRNAWWRTTAQRLLLERQETTVLPLLEQVCSKSAEPLARLHALWLLKSLGGLHQPDILLQLLHDPHPRVREHACQLAEPWLATSAPVHLAVLKLADDPDARVRFQVALSLGGLDKTNVAALVKLARSGAGDRWTRLAVGTVVPERTDEVLRGVLQAVRGGEASADRGVVDLVRQLAAQVGARKDSAAIGRVLGAIHENKAPTRRPLQLAVLNGVAEGLGRRGTQLGQVLDGLPSDLAPVVKHTRLLLWETAALAEDKASNAEERSVAIRLLAHSPWDTAQPVLERLVAEEGIQELRLTAVRALAAHPRPEVPGLLMQSWKSQTPAARREIAEALMRQPDRLRYFLGEIEAGRVKPVEIDPVRARQLVNHAQTDIRDRARKLLQASLPADRKEVLEKYRAALTQSADPKRGRDVFQKHCATCHRVGGIGVDVGPDIADTRTKTPEALLVDILNPNQAIDSNYVNYVLTTKSGKVLTGMLSGETASSLTLRRAENQTDVVLRQDVDELQSTGQSLMPEGLEKNLSVAEMADLIGFLKNWRYLDGSVPLNNGKP